MRAGLDVGEGSGKDLSLIHIYYAGTGMSVLEMSHRSEAYRAIIDDAEATLRRLLDIPPSYRVL